MSEPSLPPQQGGIYPYIGTMRRTNFLVVSVNSLNRAGSIIVVEVAEDASEDVRGLLAVPLSNADPLPGQWVLCWRINYAAARRFDTAHGYGTVHSATLRAVTASIRAAIEPLS